MAQSFTYQFGSITSISPLYRTFTTTTYSIYILINIRIYSSSTSTTSSIRTLTINLIGTTLERRQGGADQALAAILAYKGFIIYVISILYNFIVSLIRISLSSTAFQFLLYLIYSSRAIYPTYQAVYATSTLGNSSSPFPRSSSMSFRISTSLFLIIDLLSLVYILKG